MLLRVKAMPFWFLVGGKFFKRHIASETCMVGDQRGGGVSALVLSRR